MQDVKVTVVEQKRPCKSVSVGEWFIIKGDKVYAPPGQGICYYSLSAMMPAMAAWQMEKGSNDHYVLNLTRFNCAMGCNVYQAERLESRPLEEHFASAGLPTKE